VSARDESAELAVPVAPEPQALSVERLAEIAARVGIATEGPWRVVEGHEIHQGAEFGDFAVYVAQTDPDCGCVQSVADAEFIAHAREDIPALLADNGRLRARVAELEAERHVTNEALDDAVRALRAKESSGSYPPALPWARLLDAEDLADFLDELAASAITHATNDVALAEVEETCKTWRLIGEAQHGHNTAPGPDAASQSFAVRAGRESDPARRAAWRMLAEPEPEFQAWLHHENRVSHDLPETGGTR
jgi:hypothetical protein